MRAEYTAFLLGTCYILLGCVCSDIRCIIVLCPASFFGWGIICITTLAEYVCDESDRRYVSRVMQCRVIACQLAHGNGQQPGTMQFGIPWAGHMPISCKKNTAHILAHYPNLVKKYAHPLPRVYAVFLCAEEVEPWLNTQWQTEK